MPSLNGIQKEVITRWDRKCYRVFADRDLVPYVGIGPFEDAECEECGQGISSKHCTSVWSNWCG